MVRIVKPAGSVAGDSYISVAELDCQRQASSSQLQSKLKVYNLFVRGSQYCEGLKPD